MFSSFNFLVKPIRLALMCLLFIPQANAHLMVAQHGTLNIVDSGAFMLLSLAISSFEGIDDDNNDEISLVEFNNHRADMIQTIKRKISLRDQKGSCPIEGIILSPVTGQDGEENAISQLTIMGRFTLTEPEKAVTLAIDLYGHHSHEKLVEVSVSRKNLLQVIKFSPLSPSGIFFVEQE